jgi:hypothetical protein
MPKPDLGTASQPNDRLSQRNPEGEKEPDCEFGAKSSSFGTKTLLA